MLHSSSVVTSPTSWCGTISGGASTTANGGGGGGAPAPARLSIPVRSVCGRLASPNQIIARLVCVVSTPLLRCLERRDNAMTLVLGDENVCGPRVQPKGHVRCSSGDRGFRASNTSQFQASAVTAVHPFLYIFRADLSWTMYSKEPFALF